MSKGWILLFLICLTPVIVYAGIQIDDQSITIGDLTLTAASNGTLLINGQVVSGAPGPQGPQGLQGEPGQDGAQGVQGIQGIQGPEGPYGDQGPKGDAGQDGAQGPKGDKGDTGNTGLQGIQGIPGVNGTNGTNGVNGVNGTNGVNGATWFSGSGPPGVGLGVNGDHYFRTDTSDVYVKATGSWSVEANIKGAQGTQGDPGADGVDGVDGAAGAAGALWYSGAGAPSGGTGINGDYYLNTSNGDVYSKSGGSWSVVGNIKGTTGNTGATGATGTTGITSITSSVAVGPSSNTEARLIGTTITANTMAAGTTYRIDAYGVLSDAASSPGTATWRVRIGSSTLTGNIACSIAPTLGTGLSNKPWHFTCLLTVRNAGSGGTCIANAWLTSEVSTSIAQANKGTAQTSTVAVDTTANKEIELTFQFGTSSSSNTLTCIAAVIELVKS